MHKTQKYTTETIQSTHFPCNNWFLCTTNEVLGQHFITLQTILYAGIFYWTSCAELAKNEKNNKDRDYKCAPLDWIEIWYIKWYLRFFICIVQWEVLGGNDADKKQWRIPCNILWSGYITDSCTFRAFQIWNIMRWDTEAFHGRIQKWWILVLPACCISKLHFTYMPIYTFPKTADNMSEKTDYGNRKLQQNPYLHLYFLLRWLHTCISST